MQISGVFLNWADLAIISIVVISAIISLVRGFVKEALSLVTWVAAFIVARLFSDSFALLLTDYIEKSSMRMAVAFGVLFIGTLIVGAIVNNLLGALVKMTGLSGTDRMLGIVFGAARGVLIVVVLIALFRLSPAADEKWWQESYLIPQFQAVEEWSRDTFEDLTETLINIGKEAEGPD